MVTVTVLPCLIEVGVMLEILEVLEPVTVKVPVSEPPSGLVTLKVWLPSRGE